MADSAAGACCAAAGETESRNARQTAHGVADIPDQTIMSEIKFPVRKTRWRSRISRATAHSPNAYNQTSRGLRILKKILCISLLMFGSCAILLAQIPCERLMSLK